MTVAEQTLAKATKEGVAKLVGPMIRKDPRSTDAALAPVSTFTVDSTRLGATGGENSAGMKAEGELYDFRRKCIRPSTLDAGVDTHEAAVERANTRYEQAKTELRLWGLEHEDEEAIHVHVNTILFDALMTTRSLGLQAKSLPKRAASIHPFSTPKLREEHKNALSRLRPQLTQLNVTSAAQEIADNKLADNAAQDIKELAEELMAQNGTELCRVAKAIACNILANRGSGGDTEKVTLSRSDQITLLNEGRWKESHQVLRKVASDYLIFEYKMPGAEIPAEAEEYYEQYDDAAGGDNNVVDDSNDIQPEEEAAAEKEVDEEDPDGDRSVVAEGKAAAKTVPAAAAEAAAAKKKAEAGAAGAAGAKQKAPAAAKAGTATTPSSIPRQITEKEKKEVEAAAEAEAEAEAVAAEEKNGSRDEEDANLESKQTRSRASASVWRRHQLFPPHGFKSGEQCYACHLNTVGAVNKRSDRAPLAGVFCSHCGTSVHFACLEPVCLWDYVCRCEGEENERQSSSARKNQEYLFCCPSCKLEPRPEPDGLRAAPLAIEDCCTFCLQGVTTRDRQLTPETQRRRSLLVLDASVVAQPQDDPLYMHALCRDVRTYTQQKHCFVVSSKNDVRKRRIDGNAVWRRCQSTNCEDAGKTGSNIIKCAIKGCLYTIHPVCIGDTVGVNLVTLWIGGSDAERPSSAALQLPRAALHAHQKNVAVVMYCPKHNQPGRLFEEDQKTGDNVMAALKTIPLGRFMPLVDAGEGDEQSESEKSSDHGDDEDSTSASDSDSDSDSNEKKKKAADTSDDYEQAMPAAKTGKSAPGGEGKIDWGSLNLIDGEAGERGKKYQKTGKKDNDRSNTYSLKGMSETTESFRKGGSTGRGSAMI